MKHSDVKSSQTNWDTHDELWEQKQKDRDDNGFFIWLRNKNRALQKWVAVLSI